MMLCGQQGLVGFKLSASSNTSESLLLSLEALVRTLSLPQPGA